MKFKVVTFYEFKDMSPLGDLVEVRDRLRAEMRQLGVKGTIILANEGFNSTIAGNRDDIDEFLPLAEEILRTRIEGTISFAAQMPFRRVDVKVKPEIVTLKKQVDISLGEGTHVSPRGWNNLLQDPDVIVLDARNDYEYRTGTFRGAINPETSKFSELPDFVAKELSPEKYQKVAMFCTGGIRCEKFTPYLKARGFEEVYQLEGGILKYLEEIGPDEGLWEGECFVFDGRISVDDELKKGRSQDLSKVDLMRDEVR